jgi:hypothetical protein
MSFWSPKGRREFDQLLGSQGAHRIAPWSQKMTTRAAAYLAALLFDWTRVGLK